MDYKSTYNSYKKIEVFIIHNRLPFAIAFGTMIFESHKMVLISIFFTTINKNVKFIFIDIFIV